MSIHHPLLLATHGRDILALFSFCPVYIGLVEVEIISNVYLGVLEGRLPGIGIAYRVGGGGGGVLLCHVCGGAVGWPGGSHSHRVPGRLQFGRRQSADLGTYQLILAYIGWVFGIVV